MSGLLQHWKAFRARGSQAHRNLVLGGSGQPHGIEKHKPVGFRMPRVASEGGARILSALEPVPVAGRPGPSKPGMHQIVPGMQPLKKDKIPFHYVMHFVYGDLWGGRFSLCWRSAEEHEAKRILCRRTRGMEPGPHQQKNYIYI